MITSAPKAAVTSSLRKHASESHRPPLSQWEGMPILDVIEAFDKTLRKDVGMIDWDVLNEHENSLATRLEEDLKKKKKL